MQANHQTRVGVQVATSDPNVPNTTVITQWVVRTLQAVARVGDDNREVSVRIVDVDEMQGLNREYRGVDAPTNVLSFSDGDVHGLPAEEPHTLGDVVICAPVLRREAESQGKPLQDHWAHMLVHGTLHLLGFDHRSESEADEMEALEVRILSDQGISDPYLPIRTE